MEALTEPVDWQAIAALLAQAGRPARAVSQLPDQVRRAADNRDPRLSAIRLQLHAAHRKAVPGEPDRDGARLWSEYVERFTAFVAEQQAEVAR